MTPEPFAADIDWRPLPPRAAALFGLAYAIPGLLLVLPLALLGWALNLPLPLWASAVLGALLAAVIGALLGRRRWRSMAWRLDAQGLRVRRGWIWHKEILVPRSRVQHLDLERGPLERRRRLATLIVHTAGTRLSALRQSGLDDADAMALRDALVPEAERHDDAL
ncbi:MAG TPA: PH domain-containing protein [Arenimonas sp.]|nr:PH domain-containing protein [Arenimonas sp.]